MSNQTSTLSIVLNDNVTGPAKGIGQALKNLGFAAKDVEKLEKIGRFRELQKGLAASRTDFVAAQQNVKGLAAEIAKVDKPTRQMTAAFKAAQRDVKSTAAAYKAQVDAIKTARTELASSGVSLKNIGTEEARLRSQIESTTRAIRSQTAAHKAMAAARRAATSTVATTAAGVAGLATGHRAVSFGKKAVVSAAEFDTATRLQRVYSDIDEGTQSRVLSPQAKRIGQETPFTNMDVVKAQTAAMQGLPSALAGPAKAQVAAGMIEYVKYYATLMEVDLKEAAEAVRGYLQQTGKDITSREKALTESQKAVNQIVKMAKLGGMSGDDAQTYLKYAASASTAAGVSPETMMSIGALARRGGLRGDEAGTFMRTVAAKLVNPGKPGLTALSAAGIDYSQYRTMPERLDPEKLNMQLQNRLGVSMTPNIQARVEKLLSDKKVLSSQGEFTSILLKELQPLTGSGGGAASKAKTAAALGEFYSMSAKSIDSQRLLDDLMANRDVSLSQLNALLGYRQGGRGAITTSQREEYNAARKEIGSAGDDPDFAKRKFDEVAAGLGYSLENLKGSVENLALSIGQANEGILKFSFDKIGAAFDWVSELPSAGRQAITVLAGIGALGASVGGLKLLMDGFGLKGSAIALDGSAAALTRAAAVLAGSKAVDLPGAGGAGKDVAKDAAKGAASRGLGGALRKGGAMIGAAAGGPVGLTIAGGLLAADLLGVDLFDDPPDAAASRKQRARELNDRRIKAWNEDRARLGLPPISSPSIDAERARAFGESPIGPAADSFSGQTGPHRDRPTKPAVQEPEEKPDLTPPIARPALPRAPDEESRPQQPPTGPDRSRERAGQPPDVPGKPASAPGSAAPAVAPATKPAERATEPLVPAPGIAESEARPDKRVAPPPPAAPPAAEQPPPLARPSFPKAPDAKEEYAKAGEDAASALRRALETATAFDPGALKAPDTSQFAGAGQQAGAEFTQGLVDELKRAEAQVSTIVQSIISKLSFTARPSIVPNVSAPTGGGASPISAPSPASSGSLQRASAATRGAYADIGVTGGLV